MLLVFFFKQKTAYEMRISDWSSDVCSSDLRAVEGEVDVEPEGERIVVLRRLAVGEPEHRAVALVPHQIETRMSREAVLGHRMRDILHPDHSAVGHPDHREQNRRSEEHTSELQSLMRISYAVFCLKKKTTIIIHTIHTTQHTEQTH